ncbi:hypothetical protein F2Q69_00035592 [Brassica cretica]|uniref:Uncharacterized protein n=1 Tax=Brassica cretica TaxID=69181 RepID=A0A8S9SFT1_BRACR|nr:hypothetical protein F2Q69_00035592 [Brassica cretica]
MFSLSSDQQLSGAICVINIGAVSARRSSRSPDSVPSHLQGATKPTFLQFCLVYILVNGSRRGSKESFSTVSTWPRISMDALYNGRLGAYIRLRDKGRSLLELKSPSKVGYSQMDGLENL